MHCTFRAPIICRYNIFVSCLPNFLRNLDDFQGHQVQISYVFATCFFHLANYKFSVAKNIDKPTFLAISQNIKYHKSNEKRGIFSLNRKQLSGFFRMLYKLFSKLRGLHVYGENSVSLSTA